MIQAVIFDVDGTLLDTERIYVLAWQQAARELGFELPLPLLLQTRAISAKDAAAIIEEAIPGISYEAARPGRIAIAERLIEAESPLQKPGVEPLLAELARRRIKTAVATSTGIAHTKKHLALSNLSDRFDAIVTGDMVAHGKPAPDIFLKAASLLGVAAEHCLVAEDSGAGIRAARNAGMQRVLIPDIATVPEEERALCTAVFTRIDEMIGLLGRL